MLDRPFDLVTTSSFFLFFGRDSALTKSNNMFTCVCFSLFNFGWKTYACFVCHSGVKLEPNLLELGIFFSLFVNFLMDGTGWENCI